MVSIVFTGSSFKLCEPFCNSFVLSEGRWATITSKTSMYRFLYAVAVVPNFFGKING